MTELPSLLVGVPVLGRPQNAAPLVANLAETTPHAGIVFILSPGDDAEWEAMPAAINDTQAGAFQVDWEPGIGDFARKHNWAFANAMYGYDFYFVGADDLRFHPGWYEACLEAHDKTGACVIGTRDLGNQRTMNGWHSTHFLVHRDYLECGTIDEPGKLFHEGYHHEFCDDECVQTARFRRTYAASQAVVEHLHPDWGKAEWDDTYRRAQANRAADAELFRQRRRMFGTGHAR